MNLTFLAIIGISTLIGISGAFAQGSIITFDIDEKSFVPGEIVELTGNVDRSLAGQPVAIEVKDSGGSVILIRTVTPDSNGDFVLKFKIPTTAKAGDFEIITNVEVAGEAFTETKKVVVSQTGAPSGGGGCLIATATFGSELAPQVQQLRELRDNTLLQTKSGSAFMTGFNQFYYSFSPTIADWERQNPAFKEAVKLTITPMLSSLSILNYVDMDSEAEVLGYGISLILLNVGMYIAVPIGIGMVLVKNLHSFQISK